ncbi:MAG: HAMP domain-containing protein [Nitrospira sp.]|nr:HAMP domain-containing protein [Nitrospira sp.]
MPLRVRLTLWYGSALAMVLITFSVVLYVLTARNLRDDVDQSLEETATAAVRSLQERGFLPLIDEEELLSQFPELARIDKFFQIFSPSGTITIRSPNIRQHEVPLSRTALEATFNGQTILESAKYPHEPPLRLISVPIIHRGNLLYIVQVGTSMESIEDTLRRFLILLIVAVPIALAVSLAAGWFLAGRALRPVDAITLAAQRITAGDLSQRLTMSAAPDEIGRLAGTFNNMIGRLDTSFRQIRQFTSAPCSGRIGISRSCSEWSCRHWCWETNYGFGNCCSIWSKMPSSILIRAGRSRSAWRQSGKRPFCP